MIVDVVSFVEKLLPRTEKDTTRFTNNKIIVKKYDQ